MKIRKFIVFAALTLIITTLMTSCVYMRFLKVKNQMANFSENFEIDDKDGLSLIFLNPVLRPGDMVWLMGTEPTIMEKNESGEVWVYELVKRYKNINKEEKNYDIPFKLIFTDGKLRKINLPERFTEYFSKSLFEKFLTTFGKAEISKEDKKASSKYEGMDRTEIPSTKEILAVLGLPYYKNFAEDENTYIYRYRILSPDPEKNLGIRITYNFDRDTDLLKSVEANIKGLKIMIEFTKLKNSNQL